MIQTHLARSPIAPPLVLLLARLSRLPLTHSRRPNTALTLVCRCRGLSLRPRLSSTSKLIPEILSLRLLLRSSYIREVIPEVLVRRFVLLTLVLFSSCCERVPEVALVGIGLDAIGIVRVGGMVSLIALDEAVECVCGAAGALLESGICRRAE